MNKPAAKEPSMDEILSSIRQIIADDDAANSNADRPVDISDEPPDEEIPSFDAFLEEEVAEETPEMPEEPEAPEEDIEALALSLDQVVADSETADDDDDATVDEDLSSPEDIAFVSELAEFDLEPEPEPEPVPEPQPEPVHEPEPEPMSSMPDPDLSSDLTEHLLNETAEAAASDAFSKLGVLSLGAGGQTIEGVVKELLRPMLKAWLDENLPSIVERLVEREIERVSRGGR